MQAGDVPFCMQLDPVLQPRKLQSFDILGYSLILKILSFLDELDLSSSIILVSKLMQEVTMQDDLWLTILNQIIQNWPAAVRDSFLKIERKLCPRKQVVLIKRSRCQFCGRQCTSKVALGKVGLDAIESLRLRICTKCQPKYLITKSFAKSHFLVTDKALSLLPSAQKSWYGKKCKLYFQPSVLHISLQRWKTESILEKERENRRPFDRTNPSLPPWKRLTKTKQERPPSAGGLPAICGDFNMFPGPSPAVAIEPYPMPYHVEGQQQQAPAYPMPNHYVRIMTNTLPPPSLILNHPGYSEPQRNGKLEAHDTIMWGIGDENYWSSNEMFAD